MGEKYQDDDIINYIGDKESVANKYVMKCFNVTMLVYALTFLLNLFKVFTIEQSLMFRAFLPSLLIYLVILIVYKKSQLSSTRLKYFLLFSIILVFTITGIFLTYHVVLIVLLPILYVSLYSSKKLMVCVYILTVISTTIQVYGGFYWGLCDANMLLLTSGAASSYIVDGEFILKEVNSNPSVSLFLFFVLPRCLIYIAFMSVCGSIFKIVSGSLEKARLNEELKALKEEAERANKAKSQLLARISHEIRTPINAVLGMNEMIIRESSEEGIRKYAEDAKESSVILLSIVNEILDSSKVESGKMELVSVDYEISSVFNDVYNMIVIKAKDKGLELEFDLDAGMPCGYNGDVRMVRQILINLLNNAIKYTNEGKVTLKVRAVKQDNQAELSFSIIDTGIGIKEEDLSKLAEEFQRFDPQRNKNVEGTGLGMYIVKSFLKLMDSELHVSSEYGKGSEFSFVITQKITNETPLQDFRERLQKSDDSKVNRTTYTAPEAKILVVDDYKMNLKVFKNLLGRTQIQVVEAQSGRECLELVKEQDFNMVFLDHMMPDMDGIDTLKAIKEQGLCKDVPIVMLTANAIVGNREKYLAMGFDDFLSKPIIPDKLDSIILRHLPEKYIIKNEENEMNISATEITPDEVINRIKEKLPEVDLSVIDNTFGGDKDFYLELLKDFAELTVKAELTEFSNTNDANNYCIRVHGFKNNAYTIGAKVLGDLAYELEQITREEINDKVFAMQKDLFEQYDRICNVYKGDK